jgi:hypothetical protein
LSSGKPSACESRCLMVIRASRLSDNSGPRNSGTYVRRIVGDSFPSSRSFRIEIVVKLFVIDAIRNTVSTCDRRLRFKSRKPNVPV